MYYTLAADSLRGEEAAGRGKVATPLDHITCAAVRPAAFSSYCWVAMVLAANVLGGAFEHTLGASTGSRLTCCSTCAN